MNLNEAWNTFLQSGSPESYIQYANLRDKKEDENADFVTRISNKSDGCRGE